MKTLKLIGLLLLSIFLGLVGGTLLCGAISCGSCLILRIRLSDTVSNLVYILCVLGVGLTNLARLMGK